MSISRLGNIQTLLIVRKECKLLCRECKSVCSECNQMEISAQIYNAVADNDVDALKQLMENGADPNELYEDMQNISSMSILHVCANKGRLECAKCLVEYGAEIRTRDQWGMTPVAYSIISNHPDLTDYLLSKCPDAVDSFDKFGKSALHSALEYDRIECLEILLKHSAEVNIATMQGITPLMCLCGTKNLENKKRMLSMLIDAGANIEDKDLGTKRTPLQYAAVKKNVYDVETLIGLGCDVNTIDASGRTPLTNVMFENIKKNSDVIDDDVMTIIILLIQTGSDLNMKVCEYSNPLMVATLLGADTLIQLFIEFGADTNINFASGITPILAAVSQRKFSAAKILVANNCKLDVVGCVTIKRREEHDFDPFQLAVYLELWDFVQLFVAFGYNLSKHTYLRDPCLDFPIPKSFNENSDMLRYLRLQAAQPKTLFMTSVHQIRKCLHKNLEEKLEILPIPRSLKKDILMKDFL